uniref:Uncharacterized protein n=1 Tax=Amphimedon queenslandica TaxID=400682 RepID=A0A1X7VWP6_AMPQE
MAQSQRELYNFSIYYRPITNSNFYAALVLKTSLFASSCRCYLATRYAW